MTHLLRFLIDHFAFLLEDSRFRFVDSSARRSDAQLILAGPNSQVRFTRDRGQVFADFSSLAGKKADWFSTDIIWRYLTGVTQNWSEIDAAYAAFIHDRFAQIEAIFANDPDLPERLTALHELERARAREIFG